MALVSKRSVQGGVAAWMTCALVASALLMSPVSGSAEELESKIARGGRLDEAVGGHGLGLAIAGEICALYGGALELGRSDALGGFQAVVTLPHP
jgi:hypothetical protein